MIEPRLFLCTELDRTLLPNGPQPESRESRRLFAHLVTGSAVTPVYVTGRHLRSLGQAVTNYGLPYPEYAITDVGTRIYRYERGRWRTWSDWERYIESDWAGHGPEAIDRLLRGLKPLRLQEHAKQGDLKLSYYLPVQPDHGTLFRDIKTRLLEGGVHASLMWSFDDPSGVGLLDVFPERAGNLNALEFLREHLGFQHRESLYAGDKSSSLPIMESPIPSVLVANAVEGVRQSAWKAARDAGHEDTLYLAHGGYLDMNGNYSAGILEGVAYFYPAIAKSLDENRSPGRPC